MEDSSSDEEIGYEQQYRWNLSKGDEGLIQRKKFKRVKRRFTEKPKYSIASLGLPGVERLTLSVQTQKAVKCLVGVDVTTDIPWTRISKNDAIEHLKYEDSELHSIENEIVHFPNSELWVVYIPSIGEIADEFFICLSEEAAEQFYEIIAEITLQKEKRLSGLLVKKGKPWTTFGSHNEVCQLQNSNNRPLLEVEMETPYPIQTTSSKFTLSFAENLKNGYVEILSLRKKFLNINRCQIDSCVQVKVEGISVLTQTNYMTPKQIGTEYNYTYTLPIMSKTLVKSLNAFARDIMSVVGDKIYENSYFNFYMRDYQKLRKIDSPIIKTIMKLKEFASFSNHLLNRDKNITALCWHPMWSGVVAISYTTQAPNISNTSKFTSDEVLDAILNVSPVLLWSIDDYLEPKLFLETPRDITALSFCPYDENILIGGCVNGQVVIWDLKNKLEKVEEEKVLTSEQQFYKAYMSSLVQWMKNVFNPKIVRVTATSDLKYSHSDAVTNISWVSPYNEFTVNGVLVHIPQEKNRKSLQFTTISMDGTIQIWNLLIKLTNDRIERKKISRRLNVYPDALTTDVSPFRQLNRIFRPIFKVELFASNTTRLLPIVAVSRPNVPVTYVELSSHSTRRKYYYPEFHYSTNVVESCIVLGSAEGDVLLAKWEGYNYNLNEIVAKQSSTIECFSKFHDGVVVCIEACPNDNKLILSVGGKIFALWYLDYPNRPITWRKCKCRYTYGTWSTSQRFLLMLCRSDGFFEQWNFSKRSDRYEHLNVLSGGPIIGVYGHKLPSTEKIVGIADCTRAFRLFYMNPETDVDSEKKSMNFLKRICDEMERKRNLSRWNKRWNEKNRCTMDSKIVETLETDEMKPETTEIVTEVIKDSTPVVSLSASAVWRQKKVKQMQRTTLNKKGYDLKTLKKQVRPLIEQKEELKKLQNKLETRNANASKIFENEVFTIFGNTLNERLPTIEDPYAGGDLIDRKPMYIENYIHIESFYGDFINENKFQYDFKWSNLMKSGRRQRFLLDSYDERNIHKHRLQKERIQKAKQLAERLKFENKISNKMRLALMMDDMLPIEEEEIILIKQLNPYIGILLHHDTSSYS
ncbi:hypothetical protein FQA39_LY00729 [Lamprigera yunnana]|nr:hypothetical protein FQA39_LY00729 [Lamprigera yunnana]